MAVPSLRVDLIRLIRVALLRHENSASGVSDVVAGIDRHLANAGSRVSPNPVLPAGRETLLDLSIAAVTEAALQAQVWALRRASHRLTWRIDQGLFYSNDADVGEGYLNGNLHTELIGPGGCVFRDQDFTLGVFMLSPATLYRDHCHDAPELYLNWTGPCGWRFDGGGWQNFEAGSVVWNPAGRAHAMKTFAQPFLSVYSWTENVRGLCRVVPMDDWRGIEAELVGVGE